MDKQLKSIKKSVLQLFISLCLITALIGVLSPHVQATTTRNDSLPCSLSLDCSSSDTEDAMVFDLYRVADGTQTSGFTLCDAFANYRVNLSNLDDSGWSAAAYTLAAYTGPDEIAPLESASADSRHVVDFDQLPDGLYLVAGQSLKIDGKNYTAVPTLVALPNRQQDGELTYDLKTKPKITVRNALSADSLVDVNVVKNWNDGGQTEMRPASVEVNLLCDGKLYERRNLTAADYWRHTWTGLRGDCEWTVIERNVSDPYCVIYGASNTTDNVKLTVTNSCTATNTNNNQNPATPDSPAVSRGSSDTRVTVGTLPQTGLLWWPATLLAASGVLIFGLGWRSYFNQDRKNDEK
jgi:hypothetical protein